MIYLDYASSTPCDKRVIDEMNTYFSEVYFNPSNNSSFCGKLSNKAIIHARKSIAEKFNCYSQNLIFTSGATESNNLAIQGVLLHKNGSKYHYITSSIEHKSVLEIFKYYNQIGVDVTFIKPENDGNTSIEKISQHIKENTRLISLMCVNNETGTINDIESLSKICEQKNILLHTDATQFIGKKQIDLQKMKVDFLTLSGHKIYGPKGIGLLYVKNENSIKSIFLGGGQEHGIRPGTLNVPGIIGLNCALTICSDSIKQENNHTLLIRNYFEQELLKISNNIIINGVNTNRVANISSVTFPIKKGQNILDELNKYEYLCCSSGSACDTQNASPSHVLTDLGKNWHDSKNTIRFSYGNTTSMEEINFAIGHIKDVFSKIEN